MNRSVFLPLLTSLVAFSAACLQAADVPAKKAAARGALPDSVEKRTVTIFSDGVRMAGDLYLPRGLKPDEKLPAIVFCAGTGGTKGGTGGRLGPIFAQAGYVALAFDYRGWGESDSKLITLEKQSKPDAKGEVEVKARAVRWQMDFADQAMDIRAAISFIAGEPNVDAGRIGIWGSSYGGGLVVWTAANDPRVKCVAAQVPGMGGGRGPAAEKYAYGLATKQARCETEPVTFDTGKMTGKMSGYEQMRVNPAKSIGYSAIEAAEKIKVPTLIIDAENEELMDRHQNGEKVAEIVKSRGVPVRYHVLKEMTHYGVYAEGFAEATKLELEWFNQHLKGAGKTDGK
ncbi:MAG: prolyl oligopeptidase family serine peptidase [Verrucomicrobia bacterium]|nr:prolyl oligopeptidase family serine peptidase [Verrucomicrobiota bacterium]